VVERKVMIIEEGDMAGKPWLKNYEPHVPQRIQYPDSTIPQFLLDTEGKHPRYIASTFNDSDITYEELNGKVNGMAHALKGLGVEKGDRVALLLPNTPTYIIAYYAVLKIGAVVVNINVGTQGEELKIHLHSSEAKVVITLDIFIQNLYRASHDTFVQTVIIHSVFGLEKKVKSEGLPAALIFNDLVAANPKEEPAWECLPQDLAVLQYTSGATGVPKAVMLTHRSVVASIMQSLAWIKVPKAGNAAVLCIIPFFHVFGMNACLNLSVAKGYRMILMPRFDWLDLIPLLNIIEKYRPISLPVVPSLWAALLSSPRASKELFASVAVPTSGGAPLPEWVRKRYEELTGGMIYEAYGLSEASSAALFAPYPGGAPRGSIGVPLPDTDARIVQIENDLEEVTTGEVGELVLRGPQIMQGYWRNDPLTRKTLHDGWLYTGDLARMDEKGFFYLMDRRDDLIITGGLNVYPSDVENVLATHPALKEVAVVGAHDRMRGQAVTAYVVLKENAKVTREELLAFCREYMPDFKIPKAIHIVGQIPRNTVGKPLRRALKPEGDEKPDSGLERKY
jgi:long-chain acyl-CoA synthetase